MSIKDDSCYYVILFLLYHLHFFIYVPTVSSLECFFIHCCVLMLLLLLLLLLLSLLILLFFIVVVVAATVVVVVATVVVVVAISLFCMSMHVLLSINFYY